MIKMENQKTIMNTKKSNLRNIKEKKENLNKDKNIFR